jgi:malonyl-CoA decarboxylase
MTMLVRIVPPCVVAATATAGGRVVVAHHLARQTVLHNERVHPVTSCADLRQRLGGEPRAPRRCYALYDKSTPPLPLTTPLAFTNVALLSSFDDAAARRVDRILAPPATPTTQPPCLPCFIFYSINAVATNRRGLGATLIHAAVDDLTREFGGGATQQLIFSTLSPLPHFRAWLDARLGDDSTTTTTPAAADVLLTSAEVAALLAVSPPSPSSSSPPSLSPTSYHAVDSSLSTRAVATLRDLLASDRRRHHGCSDEAAVTLSERGTMTIVDSILQRLGAHYLVHAERDNGSGRAACPVANFHLGNGAQLRRVNANADLAHPIGWQRAYGVMVNYVYNKETMRANAARYADETRTATGDRIVIHPNVRV